MRELLYLVGHTPKDDGKRRWFEQDDGDERLAQDRALIRRDYPGLKYGLNYADRKVFLDGTITLRAECGIPTRVRTRVVFPDSYPEMEPMAFETGNLFPHIADRHFFSDGGCCLWLPVESQWKAREAMALHGFLDHVSTFYERQLIYEASPDQRWAWGERGHGIVGYIEFVQDALGGDAALVSNFVGLLSGREEIEPAAGCPCKSGKKFKHCHAKRLVRLIKHLGKHNPFVSSRRLPT
ncbi:MAG: SEC-C metal-binding domain-containing protein [Acidobacteriota bacterium]